MDLLQEKSAALCEVLSVDPGHIIDKAGDILSAKEDKNLNCISNKHEQISTLLKVIMSKGKECCEKFIQILKDEQHHYPQIGKLFSSSSQALCQQFVLVEDGSNAMTTVISNTSTRSVKMKGTFGTSHLPNRYKQSDQLDDGKSQTSPCGLKASLQGQHDFVSMIRATRGSNVFAPVIHCTEISNDVDLCADFQSSNRNAEDQGLQKTVDRTIKGQSQQGAVKSAEKMAASITDKEKFLRINSSKLIQKVMNVDGIVDELISKEALYTETASNIRAHKTTEKQMRELLQSTNSKKLAGDVVLALCRCQGDVMEELLGPLES